ncbi:SET domain-containing protein [Glonium stellatum]|uniref:SET domain-containing protein n=1 Tax=Glonium stellatum TaxID=574774 RepID=A0A8E2JRF3_9PEZI|nr:SET domain-containing protein [Glonium stellatum]
MSDSPGESNHTSKIQKLYELRVCSKGIGAFATKDIKRGQRILADTPLLAIPKARYFSVDIEEAFAKLSLEDKKRYFELHSAHGQSTSNWPHNIHQDVSASERERIEEQHNARTGQEASLISIFQTNCMEMGQGAAVFYEAARFNHSCNASAFFSWNARIGRETIHATRDIKAGEEITLCYCDPHHDVALRRWELKHYGFECDCPACEDLDDPDSFAAISAQRRYRLRELDDMVSGIRSRNPKSAAPSSEHLLTCLLEMAALQLDEGLWTAELAYTYLDIAIACEAKGDLDNALSAARKALQVTFDCRGPDCEDIRYYVSVVRRVKQSMSVS